MVILRGDKNIPKDAVKIDETKATVYVWEVVKNWNSIFDTWALRYAPVILGGTNAICGIIINKHYRFKLKVGTYGQISSLIPITVMPGILTALFHRKLVSTDILLMKNHNCPICYELRSIAIQLTLGIVYPMMLGPTAALMMANRYSTYRVPDLVRGRKDMFGFIKKITRPLYGTLTFMIGFQIVVSSALTYFEMRNNIKLRKKISEIEKKLDHDM